MRCNRPLYHLSAFTFAHGGGWSKPVGRSVGGDIAAKNVKCKSEKPAEPGFFAQGWLDRLAALAYTHGHDAADSSVLGAD